MLMVIHSALRTGHATTLHLNYATLQVKDVLARLDGSAMCGSSARAIMQCGSGSIPTRSRAQSDRREVVAAFRRRMSSSLGRPQRTASPRFS